jgi:intracellular multiplication protein IcmV
MAIKDIFKVNRKTFFAPSDWLGLNTVKSQTNYLIELLKGVFGTIFGLKKPTQHETFEQAMGRLGITEASLNEKQQFYLVYSFFFIFFAVITVAVAIVFMIKGHFLACLISFAITLLMLSQAFRYHFWQFQIKYRKLGCTFEEWRRGQPDK